MVPLQSCALNEWRVLLACLASPCQKQLLLRTSLRILEWPVGPQHRYSAGSLVYQYIGEANWRDFVGLEQSDLPPSPFLQTANTPETLRLGSTKLVTHHQHESLQTSLQMPLYSIFLNWLAEDFHARRRGSPAQTKTCHPSVLVAEASADYCVSSLL